MGERCLFYLEEPLQKPVETVNVTGNVETWGVSKRTRKDDYAVVGLFSYVDLETMREEVAAKFLRMNSPYVFRRSPDEIALVKMWPVSIDNTFRQKFDDITRLDKLKIKPGATDKQQKKINRKQTKLKEFQNSIIQLTEKPVGDDKIYYAKSEGINKHLVLCGKAEDLLSFINSAPLLRKHFFKIESTTSNGIKVRMGRWHHMQKPLYFRDLEEQYVLYKRIGHTGPQTMIQPLDEFLREKKMDHI